MGFLGEFVAARTMEQPRKAVKFDLAREGEGAVWAHVNQVAARPPAHVDTDAVETHRAFVAALLGGAPVQHEENQQLACDIYAVPEGKGAVWEHIVDVAARSPMRMDMEALQTHKAFVASMLEEAPSQMVQAVSPEEPPLLAMPEGEGAVWEHIVNSAARAPFDMDMAAMQTHSAFVASMLAETPAVVRDQSSEQLGEIFAVPAGQGAVWEHVVDVAARANAGLDVEAVELHKSFVASLLEEAARSDALSEEMYAVPDGQGAVWEHLVHVAARSTLHLDVEAVEMHKAIVASLLEAAPCTGVERERFDYSPLPAAPVPQHAMPEGEGAVWEHVANAAARVDTRAVETHKAFVAALLEQTPVQGVEAANEEQPSPMAVPEGEGALWEHMVNVAARAPIGMNANSLETHKAFVAAQLDAIPESSPLLAAVIEPIPESDPVDDLWLVKSPECSANKRNRQISDASTAVPDVDRQISCCSVAESELEWAEA